MFRTLLEYKAERYGRQVRVISRWEPTSKGAQPVVTRTGRNLSPCEPGPVQFAAARMTETVRRQEHPRRRAGGEAKRLWSQE